ncbi:hypothetical protein D3C84_493240 [compost metagenome]
MLAAQARLIEGQVAVREDHPAEGVGNEVAAVAVGLVAVLSLTLAVGSRLQGKGFGDVVLIDLAQLFVGLQGTGEVQAAQQQRGATLAAAGEVLEELLQYPGEFGEILREVQQRAVGIRAKGDHLRVDMLANATVQVVQAGVEHRAQAIVMDLPKAEGHAQRLLALVQVQAFEGLAEARQLVGLAQHQVDRWVGVQALGVFFDTRHQLRGQAIALPGACRQQLGQAHHQHQAVDCGFAALLSEGAQKRRELTGRLVIVQIAAGRIDHHRIGAEVPIAVLRAAFTVAAGGDAGGQAGVGQQRGFACRRHANHQVPGQVRQRRRAAATGRAVGAQHGDGMLETVTQNLLVAELTGGIP